MKEITITAVEDGKHMKGSKHYTGDAVDIRSHNFPTRADKLRFLSNLRAELGKGYQLFLESEGSPNEHFHVEYDNG